jgi:hypothetical protein
MHADTQGLMALTNSSSSSSSSDGTYALLRQRFKLARNEGVPLLLGSLYGAEFLQGALAAATAVPGGGAEIILADIPQQQTLSRFRALMANSVSLGHLLAAWLLPAPAQAEALVVGADPRSRLAQQQAPDLQQLAQVLAAAAELAAGRLVHHMLMWASMACSSAAQWYGEQVHPVFFLVADPGLPDRLAGHGCAGAHEAAAAAARLLQHGGAASSGMDAAVQDLQAIRRFVASLESLLWSVDDGGCETGSSTRSSSSSSGRGGTTQSWRSSTEIAAASEFFSSVAGGELLPLRPWWVQLSKAFAEKIGSSSAQQQAAGGSLSAALAGHQHANVTAAAAYERAVMVERNAVLTDALWRAAERAAAAAAVTQPQQQQQQVVAVVGFNHVPGIQLLWEQRQQQAAAAGGTSISATPAAESGAFLPWQLAATDAAASVLELAAAGGAGLMWLAGVQRWGGGTAALRAAAGGFGNNSSSWRSDPGLARLGLLLLPAAAALLPLQREAGRLHEACQLLEQVAAVNDQMLRQELQQLREPQSNSAGSGEGGSRGLLQLAIRAQAAAAAGGGGGGIAAA